MALCKREDGRALLSWNQRKTRREVARYQEMGSDLVFGVMEMSWFIIFHFDNSLETRVDENMGLLFNSVESRLI